MASSGQENTSFGCLKRFHILYTQQCLDSMMEFFPFQHGGQKWLSCSKLSLLQFIHLFDVWFPPVSISDKLIPLYIIAI